MGPAENLNTFGKVLKSLMAGNQNGFTRDGWNGKGIFIRAQWPDENSKMGNPYLYIDATALGGECNPWIPSQTDLFAADWREV